MTILGIETSCDETSVALVRDGRFITKNLVSSQIELHSPYGGVVPEIAARDHIQKIIPLLREINATPRTVDAIAVTIGPGLVSSLLIGVDTAKTLAYAWQKPLIPVNHLEAHLYANWLSAQEPQFPLLCLLVSGGHTQLILMENHGHLKTIGQTRDDAAGEAFDKVAKLLNLPYPGGPPIEKLAHWGNNRAYSFPRPMLNQNNFDFSFSGLKTDVLRLVKKKISLNEQEIKNICASFQAAVIDVLTNKTLQAAQKYQPKTICLAGGVAANKSLCRKFEKVFSDYDLRIPDFQFCTDNAAMIAACAYYHQPSKSPYTLSPNPNLNI